MKTFFGNRKSLLLIFTCILLILISSCSIFREITQIKRPELTVQNIRFDDISFQSLQMVFDVHVDNPNHIAINMAGFDYDIQIAATSFLNGRQEKGISIPSLGDRLVSIPVAIQFRNIYDTFQTLKGQDSTSYAFHANFYFSLPVLGDIEIPLSKSGSFPLLKIPQVKIDALQIKKINLSTAELVLQFTMENPNSFAFLIQNMQYNFTVNGKDWVNSMMESPARVNEKGQTTFQIPISLNLFDLGSSVYQALLSKKSLDYSFHGNLLIDTSIPGMQKINFPVEKTGQVSIVR